MSTMVAKANKPGAGKTSAGKPDVDGAAGRKPVSRTDNTRVADYYDIAPYQSYPFAQSAPEHLEAVACLFGLDAPAAGQARVLELGCASGGNLLPFAARNPEAKAVGVDISKVHIEQANKSLRTMELKNIRFEQMDLAHIDGSFGTFDYIICHGVYSWVPEEVQQAIHRICSKCLSPAGVAYVSYNVYPGWKAREIVRDAMLFRGGERAPLERLSFARGMIDFMHKVAQPHSALKVALDEIKPLIDKSAPYYLLHEFLEPYNVPVYFNRFLDRASAGKMVYLAEAAVSPMFVSNYGSDIAEPLLRECTTQPMLEQYLDFISNRQFRQTLLVHEEQAAKIRYRLDERQLEKLSWAGLFEEQNDQRQKDDPANKTYYNSLIGSIYITGLIGHAIAEALNQAWPATVSFDDLLKKVVQETTLDQEQCRKALQGFVEEGVIKGYLRLRKTPVNCAKTIQDLSAFSPKVSRELHRILMNTFSDQDISVWNAWHQPVNLTPFEVLVGRRLDGKRNIEAIISQICQLVEKHTTGPQSELTRITNLDSIRPELQAHITKAVEKFRKKALLITA